MKDQPRVSILINNYNYGRFLGDAIDSALAQTYPNIEVIVVDDGSNDNSREVLASYGARILTLLKKENGGQASALNAGFAVTSGDIICLLDADDYFTPEKVERVVEVLTGNPSLGWCFDVVRQFDHETGERYSWSTTHERGLWDARAVTAAGKPPFVPTALSGLSFRRRTLEKIFPMPEPIRLKTGCSSDAYIKWVALALDPGWMADGELTMMRVHNSNAFTKRTADKKRLSGQLELITGIWLYDRWPVLQRLALKVFSRGLGAHWATGGLDSGYKQRVQLFVRNLTLPQRSEVLLRAMIWGTLGRLGY
jgi:glycosyltransferase involved in cell wall biosynthesis